MNIHDGNIFEAMRLVLPEHRSVMKSWGRKRNERTPPTIEDDELEQMQYMLSEALEHRSRVRLMLFGTYDDTVLEGVTMFDGRLKIATDEGVHTVNLEKLIRVEIL